MNYLFIDGHISYENEKKNYGQYEYRCIVYLSNIFHN